jgi:GNAT superfamily N-acetyltransferase
LGFSLLFVLDNDYATNAVRDHTLFNYSQTSLGPDGGLTARAVASAVVAHIVGVSAYANNALDGEVRSGGGDDGIDCPGVFLWRFMIAAPYQGRGYGRQAILRLFDHLRAQGVPELYTCCGLSEASPEPFYKRLGFTPTGEWYGDEMELKLALSTSD